MLFDCTFARNGVRGRGVQACAHASGSMASSRPVGPEWRCERHVTMASADACAQMIRIATTGNEPHFDMLARDLLASAQMQELAFSSPSRALGFLRYAVRYHPILLHGSIYPALSVLEPRGPFRLPCGTREVVFATSSVAYALSWPVQKEFGGSSAHSYEYSASFGGRSVELLGISFDRKHGPTIYCGCVSVYLCLASSFERLVLPAPRVERWSRGRVRDRFRVEYYSLSSFTPLARLTVPFAALRVGVHHPGDTRRRALVKNAISWLLGGGVLLRAGDLTGTVGR